MNMCVRVSSFMQQSILNLDVYLLHTRLSVKSQLPALSLKQAFLIFPKRFRMEIQAQMTKSFVLIYPHLLSDPA